MFVGFVCLFFFLMIRRPPRSTRTYTLCPSAPLCRSAIARAVIARPQLLVADEPTGNVDPEMAMRLLGLFEALNRLGTTVIVATHDIHLISRIDNAQMM